MDLFFITGERRTSAVWQRSRLDKNYLSAGIRSEKWISREEYYHRALREFRYRTVKRYRPPKERPRVVSVS